MIAHRTLVEYAFGIYSGIGRVVGVATLEEPVLGYMCIIEDLSGIFPNDAYGYSSFTCPTSCFKVVE